MKKTLIFILFLVLTTLYLYSDDNNLEVSFVSAVRTQIGETVLYDSSYKVLSYPNGDVPIDRGVCTDIATCDVPPHLPHIMIVSNKKNDHGTPFVIHNIGAGVQEEDRLFEFKLTGHYRIKTNNLVGNFGTDKS